MSTSEVSQHATMHTVFGNGAIPLVITMIMKGMVMMCFMKWLSTPWMVFSRLWSHKSSGVLTVKGVSSCLYGWVGFVLYICIATNLFCTAMFLFRLWGRGPSSQPQSYWPSSTKRTLVHYLPKVATSQHGDAVKILKLNCPFPADKQRIAETIPKRCINR